MQKRWILADNCKVSITESFGNGNGIPIFLFHGNSSSKSAYKALMAKNGKNHKLIAVDFPGHGSTELPKWAFKGISIQRLGEFAYKVIQKFNYNKYVIVGQSIGGHAVMENEQLVKETSGICLLSSPPISEKLIGQAFEASDIMPLLFKNNLSDKEVDDLSHHFVNHKRKELFSLVTQEIKNTDGRFRELLAMGMQNNNIRDEVTALNDAKNQVLIIRGKHDRFIRKRYYGNLPAQNMWKNKIHELDCGHNISMESPNEMWAILTDYIKHLNQNNIGIISSSERGIPQ